MYERVVNVAAKPGTADEAIRIYNESVVPAVKTVEGYQGGYLLVDRENNKSISIAMYDTLEHLNASAESGFVQEQMAKFADLFAGPPETATYEVGVKI
ncbi:MAG: antibiotic biosynthesis monooxygenase family protein [Candidatus Kariarchaeaceae archaeon]|jgi:heme-degrading monooxygenase HmoA